MRRRLAWIGCAVAAGVMLSSCSSGDTSTADSGAPAKGATITIGSDPTLPPLESLADDKSETGLAVDLVKAAAQKAGYKVKFEAMSFDALIPALASKRIDMITEMGDVPTRRDVVTYIDFMKSGAAMLVGEGNPKHVKGTDDLCGLRVAYTTGTSQQDVTDEASKKCESNGKPAVKQAAYKDAQSSALALRSKQADAAWTDIVNVDALQKQSPNTFGVAFKMLGHPYGIGFPKAQKATLKKFMTALKALQADGTYREILAKYGQADSVLSSFTVNEGQGIGVPKSAASTGSTP